MKLEDVITPKDILQFFEEERAATNDIVNEMGNRISDVYIIAINNVTRNLNQSSGMLRMLCYVNESLRRKYGERIAN